MKRFILFLFLLSSSFVYSQGKKGFQLLLTTDNDFLGINNKDENYTGAIKIEVITPELKWKWLPFYKFKVDEVLNVQRFAVGGNAYTPQDLTSKDVIIGDRPYASLLFFNFGNTSYNISKNLILQSDLMIGSMGTSGPGNAQAYIHRHHWFGSTRPIPQGWDNQIGFNGAFIVNYNTRLQGRLSKREESNSDFKWFQANWVAKADIGNYMINLQGGIKLNLLNYNSGILQDFNPDLPTLRKLNIAAISSKKCLRFNLFFEPHARIAVYNATLEGLMFNDHSIYKIDHSEVKRLLFEINTGVNLLLGDFLYLRYSLFGRSREFSGGKPFHSWGGITIGLSPARWNHNK